MIYLLHGDDTASSRKFLSEISEGIKSIQLDGTKITSPIVEENLLSNGLFEDEKIIVIENLFTKNKNRKEIVDVVNKTKTDFTIIFWEDKKVPKTAFSSLKDVTVREFSFPSFYFQFLDNFLPAEKKKTFQLYHELLKTYSAEQIFYSLIKRIRYLAILSGQATTDEISKMNPWVREKMQKQQGRWERHDLLRIYEKLQDTEIKLKTGKLPTSLSKHLDILILTHL